MNLLKSIFVTSYMVAAIWASVYAAGGLIGSGDFLSWGGALLVYAPFVLVLSWLTLFRNVARTSAHFPVLIALGAIGLIVSVVGYLQGGNQAAPVLAGAGLVAFVAYAYWYSGFGPRHSHALVVGNMLPAFELRNREGEWVSSTTLLDKTTVWMFYRGNWCPLCMAQVREIAGRYRELEQLGARVALVSPQPHRNTVRLAQRFDVGFEFLSDANNAAAKRLGINHDNGLPMGLQMLGYDSDTVLPTVIVTGRGGRILWVDQTDNYRVRPEPATFIQVLKDNEGALRRAA